MNTVLNQYWGTKQQIFILNLESNFEEAKICEMERSTTNSQTWRTDSWHSKKHHFFLQYGKLILFMSSSRLARFLSLTLLIDALDRCCLISFLSDICRLSDWLCGTCQFPVTWFRLVSTSALFSSPSSESLVRSIRVCWSVLGFTVVGSLEKAFGDS